MGPSTNIVKYSRNLVAACLVAHGEAVAADAGDAADAGALPDDPQLPRPSWTSCSCRSWALDRDGRGHAPAALQPRPRACCSRGRGGLQEKSGEATVCDVINKPVPQVLTEHFKADIIFPP